MVRNVGARAGPPRLAPTLIEEPVVVVVFTQETDGENEEDKDSPSLSFRVCRPIRLASEELGAARCLRGRVRSPDLEKSSCHEWLQAAGVALCHLLSFNPTHAMVEGSILCNVVYCTLFLVFFLFCSLLIGTFLA